VYILVSSLLVHGEFKMGDKYGALFLTPDFVEFRVFRSFATCL